MRKWAGACALAALAAAMAAATARAGSTSNDGAAIGLDDLLLRIGIDNLPTGAGIVVAQVEDPDAEGDYSPNPGNSEFTGKTLIPMSGATATSGHANAVGRNFYGNTISVAPAIDTIYLWDVNLWASTGFLGTNTTSLPSATPGGIKVFNHSYIGNFGTASSNNNALRRVDWVIVQDDVVMCMGIDNDEPGITTDGLNLPLMGHAYNGLTVGVSNGQHTTGDSLASIDGPGRQIPQIVAPGAKTSWAIPVVAASASLLVETARTAPQLTGDAGAERSELIKAVLLAGTNHRVAWTNNPVTAGAQRGTTSQPLDDVYGADLVNIDTSHFILTRTRQTGAAAPAQAVNAGRAGWDLTGVGPGESRYWGLRVCSTADEAVVAATWNRQTQYPFGTLNWATADFELILWHVGAGGGLETMVGDPGLAYFSEGNVASDSAVDNIEYLYLKGLAPGQYVIELHRKDNLVLYPQWDAAVAWHLPPTGPTGDLDGDCAVSTSDFLLLLSSWGPCPDPCPVVPCPADLNGDCTVSVADFLELLTNWG